MDRLAISIVQSQMRARISHPGGILTHQLRRFARKARHTHRAADVEAVPFFEQMPHEEQHEEDFEYRFDETNADSVLEDVSNTQLRKLRPGVGRARALFESPDFAADPDSATSSTRKDTKARYRVANLRPDNSLVREDGTIESIIKVGREEKEELLQQQKRKLEKEKALRAQHRNRIHEMAGGDRGPERPPREAADLYTKKPAAKPETSVSAKPANLLSKDDILGKRGLAAEHGISEEAGPPQSTTSQDIEDDRPLANGRATSNYDAGIAEVLSPDQMLQRVSGASPLADTSRSGTSRGPRQMRTASVSMPWTAAVGHQPRGGRAALSERLAVAESSAGILAVVAGHEKELDGAHAVAALSMVARSATMAPVGRKGLPDDQQMMPLLRRLASHIDSLTPTELCDVLSAVARLGVSPRWLGQALSRAAENSRTFDNRCAATALLALGRLNAAAAPEQAARLLLALRRALLSRPDSELRALDALEVVSLCAALARLRVHDPQLFRPLTANLTEVLQQRAESGLVLSDVVSSIRAVAIVGHATPSFIDAAEQWLHAAPFLTVEDFVALCSALERAPAEAKEVLAANVVRPWLLKFAAMDKPPLFCSALAAANHASLCDDATRNAVAEALGASQMEFIGREIGVVARALAPAAPRAPLYRRLASGAARAAPDLLPGELVEVISGFATARAEAPELWPNLQAALLRTALRLPARDAARALLALSTVGVSRHDALRATADTLASGAASLPWEEALNLLKNWSQLHAEVRTQQLGLPRRLASRLAEEIGSNSAGSWRAPPEPLAAAFSWIASWRGTCDGISEAETIALGEAAGQTLHALLPMISRMVASMEPLRVLNVVSDLGMGSVSSNLDAVRSHLQQTPALRDSLDEAFGELGTDVPVGPSGADFILGLAAVGLDGPAFRAWVRRRLVDNPGLLEMGALCWACAEMRAHASVALTCVKQEVAKQALDTSDSAPGDDQATALLRMAWAASVLEEDCAIVSALVQRSMQIAESSIAERRWHSAAELRGWQQLAWQTIAWDAHTQVGNKLQRWAGSALARAAETNSPIRIVCTALERLGIEHNPVGQPPLQGMPCVGGVAMLPKQQVMLVIRSPYDQTASGASAGGAALRQQLIQATGWGIVSVDLPSPRMEVLMKDASQVQASIASALVRALPGEYADLSTIAAAQGVHGERAEVSPKDPKGHDMHHSQRQKRRSIRRPRA